MTEQSFRVDLRGVVDLLSHHLYSSPRVYLRELVQNAADALSARSALRRIPVVPHEPGQDDTTDEARPFSRLSDHAGTEATSRPGDPSGTAVPVTVPRTSQESVPAPEVLVVPADVAPDGRVHCFDTGIGLRPEEVDQFLATIGASAKRDELGFARGEFLGQFGIGLLSCFLVADEIEVLSRSATGGPLVRWVGHSDGTYRVGIPTPDEIARAAERLPRAAVEAGWDRGWLDGSSPDAAGTWVALRTAPGSEDWTRSGTVTDLVTEFAQMLDRRVFVATGDDGIRRITVTRRPWDPPVAVEPAERLLAQDAERLLGVRALAALPIAVPEAGLRGIAAILADPVSPSTRQSHRVYAKGMLVSRTVTGLLPEWAFFARCVVNAEGLRLTASRESLYDDDLLETVRIGLGEQVRRWLLRVARVDPDRFAAFLRCHELAVKAMAAHDDDLLRAVLPLLRFETSAGPLTLLEVAEQFGVIRHTATVEEYRQVCAVATAQRLGVVNAGYTYDLDLLARVSVVHPSLTVIALTPGDLESHIAEVPDGVALLLRPALEATRRALEPLEVDVELRQFEPAALPALVLDDREARHRRASRAVTASSEPDDPWGALLQAIDDAGHARRRLLLNHNNPTVRRVLDLHDPELLVLAVEGLFCQSLLLGQHALEPTDLATLHRSFLGLLDRCVADR